LVFERQRGGDGNPKENLKRKNFKKGGKKERKCTKAAAEERKKKGEKGLL